MGWSCLVPQLGWDLDSALRLLEGLKCVLLEVGGLEGCGRCMATRVKIVGMRPLAHLEAKESKIMNEIKKSKLVVARTDVEKRFVKF